jgi:restriction system protein
VCARRRVTIVAIPDYQSIMLPLLKSAGDKKEHSLREAIETLAQTFSLTDNERRELLPSGRQATFDNRVGWARTYMKMAGLLVSTRRAHFQITERGLSVLNNRPTRIDTDFLSQFPEFVEFRAKPKTAGENAATEKADTQTPEEQIDLAYQRVRQNLAAELTLAVKSCSPAFFEQLVVDLLVQMGYGGTRKDAGQAIGGSGDGGIDGIIKQDRLGLDTVYIQAKRWEGTVSRPEIQKFVGALQGQRARRGVFITTSDFSQAARDYSSQIESKIVLIDGQTLAQLMIDFSIGVTTFAAYELKRVDSDYFTEG